MIKMPQNSLWKILFLYGVNKEVTQNDEPPFSFCLSYVWHFIISKLCKFQFDILKNGFKIAILISYIISGRPLKHISHAYSIKSPRHRVTEAESTGPRAGEGKGYREQICSHSERLSPYWRHISFMRKQLVRNECSNFSQNKELSNWIFR